MSATVSVGVFGVSPKASPPSARSWTAAACPDEASQRRRVVARGLLAGEGAEEDRKSCHEIFVFEDVIRNAPGVDGGAVEELEPILGALFEAKLFGLGTEGFFVPGRREHLAFDLAPVARIVAVLQTEFAQTASFPGTQFFYEFTKQAVVVIKLPQFCQDFARRAISRFLVTPQRWNLARDAKGAKNAP